MTLRKFLLWLCLGFIAIVLMIVSSEALLRLAGKKPFHVNSAHNNFWKYDSLLGWRSQPGQQGFFEKTQEFRTKVSINGKGLRDREYSYKRIPGKRRILVLGDSFAWGFGVEQQEIFTELLENMFDDVEVINAGVSGYGTDQELLWFKTEGFRYEPDLVILEFCGNDLYENSHNLVNEIYHKPRYLLDSAGQLRLQNVPVPPISRIYRTGVWLKRHFAVFSYLNMEYRYFFYSRAVKRNHTESFRLTVALLSEIRKMSGRFMMVATDEFWGTREKYTDFIHDLKTAGFPVLDVKSCPGYNDTLMKVPNDYHWNSRGHRFVAREIFDYIDSLGLLESGSVHARN